ncbi:hypothetical protein LTR95_019535, partial [Oleoguttula sp. CCFEE 5521]
MHQHLLPDDWAHIDNPVLINDSPLMKTCSTANTEPASKDPTGGHSASPEGTQREVEPGNLPTYSAETLAIGTAVGSLVNRRFERTCKLTTTVATAMARDSIARAHKDTYLPHMERLNETCQGLSARLLASEQKVGLLEAHVEFFKTLLSGSLDYPERYKANEMGRFRVNLGEFVSAEGKAQGVLHRLAFLDSYGGSSGRPYLDSTIYDQLRPEHSGD